MQALAGRVRNVQVASRVHRAWRAAILGRSDGTTAHRHGQVSRAQRLVPARKRSSEFSRRDPQEAETDVTPANAAMGSGASRHSAVDGKIVPAATPQHANAGES